MLRRRILWASALTIPLGLTEPFFVPAYWNPPSLFDLAHRTGFDIESLIFCFAIGGLAAAGYRALAPVAEHVVTAEVRSSHLHRWHRAALVSPFIVFGGLLMLPWNPIYPGIVALVLGALASGLCRPDLWRNILVGGVVFLALYTVFLLGLKSLWPGYIESVWNLGGLIAWRPAGLPLEELLFGFGFGMYWSSVYEHVTWRQPDVLRLRVMTATGEAPR
jgi:lycopene cyclase-like protein